MFRRRRLLAVAGAGAALIVPLIVTVSLSSPGQAVGSMRYHRSVCTLSRGSWADCHAIVATNAQGTPMVTGAPAGLSPATLDAAYGLPGGTAGAGKTIAVVDAYNDPTAASDLATFDTQFGLPACTTANGCFKQVNETGGSSLPANNGSWSLEISLDIEWAHAVAPGANIVLVEANSSSFTDLLTGEDYAKTVAQYVSNSWGGSEFNGETTYDSAFVQPGVSFFVAAGDSGLPAEYPSTSPNVISVGGTTLNYSGGQLQSETGWTDGGGGCSSFETANSAQSAFSQYAQVSCSGHRATPDVSSDADPNSGVAVYDSTPYQGQSGWFQVGGTSLASPTWAAMSADAGVVVNASYVYGTNINFRDITSGNNGASCLAGFDLCSGRGSWIFSSGTTTTTTTLPTTTTTVPVTTTTVPVTTTTIASTTTTIAATTTTIAPTTTTTTVSAPATPTGLAASSSFRRRVNLAWHETTTGVTFDLYRSTSSGTETLYRTGITSNSYTDTSVTNGTTYYYYVTAVKSGVQSAKSNETSVRAG